MNPVITYNGKPVDAEALEQQRIDELRKMAEETKTQLHELTAKEQSQVDRATD